MAGKKIKERDEERSVSTKQLMTILRRLADALEAEKSFVIQVRGERIRVPRDAQLSIEHERDGDSEEVELQLKWKHA